MLLSKGEKKKVTEMNSTVFRLEGGHLYLVGSDGNLVGQRTITEKDIKAFSDWAATYENGLIKSVQEAEGTFLALGEAMYQWLDGEEVWMRHLPDFPPLTIEFQVIQSRQARRYFWMRHGNCWLIRTGILLAILLGFSVRCGVSGSKSNLMSCPGIASA